MPDSSETGEAGGKSATGLDGLTRHARPTPRALLKHFATNGHESCGLDRERVVLLKDL